jgi:hypothetical protein
MDTLTRKAVELARGGAWELLDALEVVARSEACEDFVGIAHAVGSIALAAYREPKHDGAEDVERVTECGFCGGEGEVEVEGCNGARRMVTCPECDGDGEEPAHRGNPSSRPRWQGLSASEAAYWCTLGGIPVPAPVDAGHLLTLSRARAVIETAERAMKRAGAKQEPA